MERALYKNLTEWSTRLAMLEAGDCDYVTVPREYIAQVEPMVNEWYVGGEFDADTLTVLNPEGTVRLFTELPSVSSADVFFNQNVNVEGGNALLGSGELDGDGIPADFFSDVHVRRAFNYCFDWDTFIEDIFMGEAFQRTGPIISGIAGYNAEQETFSYDLEACEAEFAEAWDGVLPETGFHLVYVYNSGNESRRAVGEILEANVESVNENYSIAVLDMPWPTFLDMLVDGRMGLFTIGWIEDYHHPHNWVHPYMHSAGAFSGFQGWPEELHEQFDAAIEACVAIADPAEQEQCYFGIQNLAYENVIDIFLTQPIGRHYEQMWMQGYFYNPAWFGFYPYAQVTGKGF
jgi:peptide/nickel transport system substrate-binding protein